MLLSFINLPRSCGEELGYTFLPCVLANLHRAPLLIPGRDRDENGGGVGALWAEHVDAVVAPASACGGPAVLSLIGKRKKEGSKDKGDDRRTILVVSK